MCLPFQLLWQCPLLRRFMALTGLAWRLLLLLLLL
jgi:hypothetical protein